MKSFWKSFLQRGLATCAGGPLILAIVYGILGASGAVETLTPREVCVGILTATVMAFIAAGITAIHQNERLPMGVNALIHTVVLYADYLIIYLLNDWIPKNWRAIGGFTGIFAVGFALIWLIIYLCVRKKTRQLNKKLPKA